MEIKKFVDIERVKEKYATCLVPGERIVLETKIDGSNASIRYDKETNSLVAFSRRTKLDKENTLNGFYIWVQSLPVDTFKEVIEDRYILFGEWMGAKHAIKYPDDVMKKFWFYDVYDLEEQKYLPLDRTLDFYNKLSNYIEKFIPVLYDGPFINWEHIQSFIGRNDIAKEMSDEGIVIKRQDCLDSKSSNNPYYLKLVCEKFSEVHSSTKKPVDPAKLAARQAEEDFVRTIVTDRRIQKKLDEMIEDNIIPTTWDETNMKDISRELPKRVYEDCRKEEPEVVNPCENFGKICAKITMTYVRRLLNGWV